ncbi:MAG: tyrosine-type recombinase/integrase, partial [Salaquimonas sp.]
MTLLSELPRELIKDYVFAGQGIEGHIINLRKPWHRIRAEIDLDDVRLHDLRHSFASIAAGEGMSLHIIGKLLGHTQAITTQR